jgi:ankyrin repeat protein
MSVRKLPVRPDLAQLKHQAKDLHRAIRRGDSDAIAADGIGGYTALFSAVVSQHNFWVNYGKGQPDEARFTRLLLDRGANPNVRASLRHRFEDGHGGGSLRDYLDVTALGWADRFPQKVFVSRESVRLIEGRAAQR